MDPVGSPAHCKPNRPAQSLTLEYSAVVSVKSDGGMYAIQAQSKVRSTALSQPW